MGQDSGDGGIEVLWGDGMYTDQLIEHFKNPRNVGEIPDADGIGTIGDPGCGDYLSIFIKVKEGRLSEVKFAVYGCPAAIATTSVLTEIAIGKTIAEALEITDHDIAAALGGLPDPKMHCSNLGTAALYQAVLDYLYRR
ncbi:MAG: iron-sulfur cluster assembly scaffold protein [Bacillota bacterium]